MVLSPIGTGRLILALPPSLTIRLYSTLRPALVGMGHTSQGISQTRSQDYSLALPLIFPIAPAVDAFLTAHSLNGPLSWGLDPTSSLTLIVYDAILLLLFSTTMLVLP